MPHKALFLEHPEALEKLIDRFKHTQEVDSFRAFMGKPRITLADIALLPAKLRYWGFS